MFTRPEGLTDDDVRAALTQGWDLHGAELEYAPIGFGSHHWWVNSDDGRWFVSVDDLTARRRSDTESSTMPANRLTAALTGTHRLHEMGLRFVVAPLPATSGALLRPLGERYVLALYPFVAGRTHTWGDYPGPEQRAAVVSRLAQLHAVDPDDCRDAMTDDFALPHLGELRQTLAVLRTPWDSGPYAEPARAMLTRHARALTEQLGRYQGLVASVRGRGTPFVLTHGEPHVGNTIDTDDGVALVDWDTLLVAPPERDLWSLTVEDASVLDTYRELTGREAGRDALRLYRLRWDLTEICLYVAQFRRHHEDSDDTREAWRSLRDCLDPARW